MRLLALICSFWLIEISGIQFLRDLVQKPLQILHTQFLEFSLPFAGPKIHINSKDGDKQLTRYGVAANQAILQRERNSPLNQQHVSVRGPFFQGWLLRMTDHNSNTSVIVIVGSFSAKRTVHYTQHYIYSSLTVAGNTVKEQLLPIPSLVCITSASARSPNMDILYEVDNIGYFHFNDTDNVIDFKFSGNLHIQIHATNRIPWSNSKFNMQGPEGWLAYTSLLPCHYYVYSVGSSSTYNIDYRDQHQVTKKAKGTGYSHIEGNYGTQFPDGWVWSEAIGGNNSASFSLTAGKFTIGPISPMTFILYIRRTNNSTSVFRTVDGDSVRYNLDGVARRISINLTSKIKQQAAALTIENMGSIFHQVYIPTVNGFSNTPGCQEAYTALASISLTVKGREEQFQFPLTALEFGGSFVNAIHKNY